MNCVGTVVSVSLLLGKLFIFHVYSVDVSIVNVGVVSVQELEFSGFACEMFIYFNLHFNFLNT